MGDRSCQNAFVVLKSSLKRAVRIGEIVSNPCDMVDRPRYEAPEIMSFSAAQATMLFKEATGTRLGPLFQLALMTGARQGELLGLEWADVDFKKSVLHIRQQLIEGKGYHEISPKLKTKGSHRSIELPDSLLSILNVHRAAMLKEKNSVNTYS